MHFQNIQRTRAIFRKNWLNITAGQQMYQNTSYSNQNINFIGIRAKKDLNLLAMSNIHCYAGTRSGK